MPISFFHGNKIESLADRMIGSLYKKNSGLKGPLICIPNPYLKKWLQLYIADNTGIAFNLDFYIFNDGLWKLIAPENTMQLEDTDFRLIVLKALLSIDDSSVFKPFSQYIKDNDSFIQPKKLLQLASRLTRYFQDYEFHRESMINNWFTNKESDYSHIEAAERGIYLMLFADGGIRGSFFSDKYTLPQAFKSFFNPQNMPNTRDLILFGPNQITPFHQRLLFELGKYMHIEVFYPNPCRDFWEDITTHTEDRIIFQKSEQNYDIELDDADNPLLKSWGKAGRETVKLLSELEESASGHYPVSSEWVESESKDPETCLEILQKCLSLRENSGNSQKANQDTTIQFVSCPDIYREVETVYHNIIYNLSISSIKMNDIAVLAPDMETYAPVIEMIFSRKPFKIDYSMIDTPQVINSGLSLVLVSIFEMAIHSISKEGFFRILFSNVSATSYYSQDKLRTWRTLISDLNIISDHISPDSALPENATWSNAFRRLRMARIMSDPEHFSGRDTAFDFMGIIPHETGEEPDSLDDLFELIEFIRFSVSMVKKHKPGMSCKKLFINIINSLPEGINTARSGNGNYEKIMNIAKIIDLLFTNDISASKSALSWPEIVYEILLSSLPTPGLRRGGYLTKGVNISGLIPRRTIPFKIIYVVGMQEGLFPGIPDKSSLNLINIKHMRGDINSTDLNQYHFLQILQSVRHKIYFTFIGNDSVTDQKFFPNSSLMHLMTYMEDHIYNSKCIIIEIPQSTISTEIIDYIKAGQKASDCIIAFENSNTDSYKLTNYSSYDRYYIYGNIIRKTNNKNRATIKAELALRGVSDKPQFIATTSTVEEKLRESYTLFELAAFLKDPFTSTLRRYYGINIDDYFNDEIPPLFLKNPEYSVIIRKALIDSLTTGREDCDPNYIKYLYKQKNLKACAPDAQLGMSDIESIIHEINDRLRPEDGRPGLLTIIKSRNAVSINRTITFGESFETERPDQKLDPINIFFKDDNSKNISIRGNARLIWHNNETGTMETLVIKNSARPGIDSIINPFILYMAITAGVHPMNPFFSNGLIIHVSGRSGIISYKCDFSSEESILYMNSLIRDYNSRRIELLPIGLILKLKSRLLADNADDETKLGFFKELCESIDAPSDRDFSDYAKPAMADIIKAKVPENAYDLAKKKYLPLIKIFSRTQTNDEQTSKANS